MANIIDISAKLEAAKPVLKLSEELQFEINDDKNTVIKLDAMINSTDDDIDGTIKAIEALIGKEAVAQIEEKMPGTLSRISQIKVVMTAISAAIAGETYEQAAARFRAEENV